MVALSSDSRLFGLDVQLTFDIFSVIVNIFIFFIIVIPIVVLFIFICKYFKDKSSYYKEKTKYYKNQNDNRQA